MRPTDNYSKSLKEFEKIYLGSANVSFSKDFLVRVQTFQGLLVTLMQTEVTTQLDKTFENSFCTVLDIFQLSVPKIDKLASISPRIALSPWNYSQQRQLSNELTVQLQSLDTFVNQIQQKILLLTLQQQINQSNTSPDILKVFDYDACKNFWKEKIGLQITKLSIHDFTELFLHMIASSMKKQTESETVDNNYSPEVFLSRVLAYTFDHNDDHEISMIEMNDRIHQLITHSIPTSLSPTSSDTQFWVALGRYLDQVQAQYCQLIQVQPIKTTTIPSKPSHIYIKPFESYGFHVTLPHFEPKECYPNDYITLVQYPSTSIHTISDLLTSSGQNTHHILSKLQEIPSSRGYFSSLHQNVLFAGRWKDSWTIQEYKKEYIDASTITFASSCSSTQTILPSSVYNYEQKQSLAYLLDHTNIQSIITFDYNPVFPSPGVYSYRIVLPTSTNPLSHSSKSYYSSNQGHNHTTSSSWIPNLFTPTATKTITHFLASSTPLLLPPLSFFSSLPTLSIAMDSYFALLEALFGVEKQAILLSRNIPDYHHIDYLMNCLVSVKKEYEIHRMETEAEIDIEGDESRVEMHSDTVSCRVNSTTITSITTQAKFLQHYSTSIVSIPHLLSEIHRLLSSFCLASSSSASTTDGVAVVSLDLTHPTIQSTLTQILTLFQVIQSYENMTEEDMELIIALSEDMHEVMDGFIAMKTIEKNPQISIHLIVEQIHTLLDVAMEKTITQQYVPYRDANALNTIIHQYIQQLYVSDVLPRTDQTDKESNIAGKKSLVATKELFSQVYKYLWNGVMKVDTNEFVELFGNSVDANTDPKNAPNALTKICEFIQHQRTIKTATTQTLSLLTSLQSSLKEIVSKWGAYLALHSMKKEEDVVSTVIPETINTFSCVPLFQTNKPPVQEVSVKEKSFKLPKLTHYYQTMEEIMKFVEVLDINTRYYNTLIYIDNNQYLPATNNNASTLTNQKHLQYEAMALLWQRLAFVLELQSFVTHIWSVSLKSQLTTWYATSHTPSVESSSSFNMEEIAILLEVFQFFHTLIDFLTPTIDSTGSLIPSEYLLPTPMLKTLVKNAAKLPAEVPSALKPREEIPSKPPKQSLHISIDHIATVLHHLETSNIHLLASNNVSTMSMNNLMTKDPLHMSYHYCITLRNLILFAIQNIISSFMLNNKKKSIQSSSSFTVQQSYLMYLQQIIVYLDNEMIRLQASMTDMTTTITISTNMSGNVPNTSQIISDMISLNHILHELQLLITSSTSSLSNTTLSMSTLTILIEAIQEIDVFYHAMTEYIFYSTYEIEELHLFDHFTLIDTILPIQEDVLIEVQDVANVIWCVKKELPSVTSVIPVSLPFGKPKTILSASDYIQPFVNPHSIESLPYKPIVSLQENEIIPMKSKKCYAQDNGKTIVITKNELEDVNTVLYLALHIPTYEISTKPSENDEEEEVYHLQVMFIYTYYDPFQVTIRCETKETVYFTNLMKSNQRTIVLPLHFDTQYPCQNKQSFDFQEISIVCQPIASSNGVPVAMTVTDDDHKPKVGEYKMKIMIQDSIDCYLPTAIVSGGEEQAQTEEQEYHSVEVIKEEYIVNEEDIDIHMMSKKKSNTTNTTHHDQFIESLLLSETTESEVTMTRSQSLQELLQYHDPIALAMHANAVYSMLPKTIFLPSIDTQHVFIRKEHITARLLGHHTLGNTTNSVMIRKGSNDQDEEVVEVENDLEEDNLITSNNNSFYQCVACGQTGFGYVYACANSQKTLHIQCAIELISQRMYAEDLHTNYTSKHQNLVLSDLAMTLSQPIPHEEGADKDARKSNIHWYGCNLCHCNLYDIYYTYQDRMIHPQCASYGVFPPKYSKMTEVVDDEMVKQREEESNLDHDHETSLFSTANPMSNGITITKKQQNLSDEPIIDAEDTEEGDDDSVAVFEEVIAEEEEDDNNENGIDEDLSYSLSVKQRALSEDEEEVEGDNNELLLEENSKDEETELDGIMTSSIISSPVMIEVISTTNEPEQEHPQQASPDTVTTTTTTNNGKKLVKNISFVDRVLILPKPSDSDDDDEKVEIIEEIIVSDDEDEKVAEEVQEEEIEEEVASITAQIKSLSEEEGYEHEHEHALVVEAVVEEAEEEKATTNDNVVANSKVLRKKMSFEDRMLLHPKVEGEESENEDEEDEDDDVILPSDDENEVKEDKAVTKKRLQKNISFEDRVLIYPVHTNEHNDSENEEEDAVIIPSDDEKEDEKEAVPIPTVKKLIKNISFEDRVLILPTKSNEDEEDDDDQIIPSDDEEEDFEIDGIPSRTSSVTVSPSPTARSSTVYFQDRTSSHHRSTSHDSRNTANDPQTPVFAHRAPYKSISDVKLLPTPNKKLSSTSDESTKEGREEGGLVVGEDNSVSDDDSSRKMLQKMISEEEEEEIVTTAVDGQGHEDESTVTTTVENTAVSHPAVEFLSPTSKGGGGMMRRGSVNLVPEDQTPVFVHRAPYKSLSDVQLRPTPKKELSDSKL